MDNGQWTMDNFILIHYPLSIINFQFSVINCQSSIINYQLSITHRLLHDLAIAGLMRLYRH